MALRASVVVPAHTDPDPDPDPDYAVLLEQKVRSRTGLNMDAGFTCSVCLHSIYLLTRKKPCRYWLRW